MDNNIWLILMLIIPFIAIVAFKVTQQLDRKYCIVIAVIASILFIAYMIWNQFLR